MSNCFEQIPLGEMERGLARSVAIIAHSPLTISKLTGIRFESGHDGFDELQGALLKTPDNKQFSLRQYRGSARHYPNKTESAQSSQPTQFPI